MSYFQKVFVYTLTFVAIPVWGVWLYSLVM